VIWWIVSIGLITLGIAGVIGNWLGALNAMRAHDGHGFSMVPMVFGIMLFFGVVTLPIEFGINRYVAAYLVMSLDVMMPIGLGFWIMVLINVTRPAMRRKRKT